MGIDPYIWHHVPARVPVRTSLFIEVYNWLHFNSRHLLGINKEDEARAALADLNGVPGDDPLVQEILEELQLGIKEENEGGKATWLECFSTRNLLWKRTGNGMMYVQTG